MCTCALRGCVFVICVNVGVRNVNFRLNWWIGKRISNRMTNSPECLPQQKCVGFFAWPWCCPKGKENRWMGHMRAPSILGKFIQHVSSVDAAENVKVSQCRAAGFSQRCHIVNFIVYRFSHFVKEKKKQHQWFPFTATSRWGNDVKTYTLYMCHQTNEVNTGHAHTLTQQQPQCVGTTTDSEWDDGLWY